MLELESSGIDDVFSNDEFSMSATRIGYLKVVVPRVTSASTLPCLLDGSPFVGRA